MDSKALFSLSYGVFILGAKTEAKISACVTNTCIQVANDPVRIAISLLNRNYTCQMIKECGSFALSVLDKSVSFDTIKHFGFQSGRDVEKFKDFEYSLDLNGNPYIKAETCAVISAKVLSSQDLGTHTLFIAEVQDAEILSSRAPVTYADYQNEIKPKAGAQKPAQGVQTDQPQKKIVGWRCKICGYELMEAELSADYICPLCGHPAEDFEPIYEA